MQGVIEALPICIRILSVKACCRINRGAGQYSLYGQHPISSPVFASLQKPQSCLQLQQDKDTAMKQATTVKRQAQAAEVEVQIGMHEQQKLKTLLENVLVSPPAFLV